METAIVNAVKNAYRSGQEDEALLPIIAVDKDGHPFGRLQNEEHVIFYDIRGEREVELTQTLTEKEFSPFERKPDTLLNFATMIEYHSELNTDVAFPPEGRIQNTLGEVLAKNGIRSLKIAESEKAIHITYFMNGKNEHPFSGEERIVVPTPEGLDSYADQPELSAKGVTDELVKNLPDPSYRVFIVNLANVDVIGHIENGEAVCEAVRTVDKQLRRIAAACQKNRVTLIVTADHGTVEDWLYPDGTVNTGHTKSPVPFILEDYSETNAPGLRLRDEGELPDVAPTILELLDVKKPEEMTGRSLLVRPPAGGGRRRICLLILDGWGVGEENEGNMICRAGSPHFDKQWRGFPHMQLRASGEAVGMPEGTVGNSEAGHLHIGAGRRILLDRVKIDRAIADGSFYRNPAFTRIMDRALAEDRALHLLGIVSFYSSHGTLDHLFALMRMAAERGLKKVFIHSLIGRRGERPE
ncbi:MAG: alkaline phosphatase family protein, partial [Candidatus Aminicenantes bacterium]|nr:alkaline phosphatase family protein [Candidatus Aminicenantes bacterium]